MFAIEKLSSNVWKIVQDDKPYGQIPFIYIILTSVSCTVIDTGVCIGPANTLRKYIEHHINTKKLPYNIFATHVHFDHIGGISGWCQPKTETELTKIPEETKDPLSTDLTTSVVKLDENTQLIAMGGNKVEFSNNYALTSLAAGTTPIAQIPPFVVTKWLKEGDKIQIGKPGDDLEYLEVLYTPGHTPDSIAIWYPAAARLFIGDTLYPYVAVHVELLGSDIGQYRETIEKLITFIKKAEQQLHEYYLDKALEKEIAEAEAASLSETQSTESETTATTTGTVQGTTSSETETETLAPPPKASSEDTTNTTAPSTVSDIMEATTTIKLSSGHVSANLGSDSLNEVQKMLNKIDYGMIMPFENDPFYKCSSYRDGQITLILHNPLLG